VARGEGEKQSVGPLGSNLLRYRPVIRRGKGNGSSPAGRDFVILNQIEKNRGGGKSGTPPKGGAGQNSITGRKQRGVVKERLRRGDRGRARRGLTT